MASTTSSSRPATPVRVPKAAGTYSPAIIDASLRSEINTLLLQGGHILKIQESLLHALHSHSSNWPTLIHNHALSILRSGDCSTFPDLVSRVLADIKADTITAATTAAATSQSQSQSQLQSQSGSTTASTPASSTTQGDGGGARKDVNGNGAVNGVNGKGKGKEKEKEGKDGRGPNGENLAVPAAVVEEGVKITKECLEVVCEFTP